MNHDGTSYAWFAKFRFWLELLRKCLPRLLRLDQIQHLQDHKALGGFTAQLKTLAECSSALGAFGQVRKVSQYLINSHQFSSILINSHQFSSILINSHQFSSCMFPFLSVFVLNKAPMSLS